MMLFEYSYLQNNGQKTKFSYKSPKTPAVEATNGSVFMIPNYSGH